MRSFPLLWLCLFVYTASRGRLTWLQTQRRKLWDCFWMPFVCIFHLRNIIFDRKFRKILLLSKMENKWASITLKGKLFCKLAYSKIIPLMCRLVKRRTHLWICLPQLRNYSMVPDCEHGRNKNVMGIFCKTTTWIKTTGVESKTLTPYKSLRGHYLKNVVQIRTTGVWLALKRLSQ